MQNDNEGKEPKVGHLPFYKYNVSTNNTVKDQADGTWGSLHCQEKNFELHAYSAFYDDREKLAGSGPPVVRVTGTSEYPRKTNVTLMCLLWYPGDAVPEVSLAMDTDVTFPAGHNGKTFQEFIYVCVIKRPVIPTLVSIICSTAAEPQFQLTVEVAEHPDTKQDFGICVCASYNERDPYQLVEWMELQKILGVSKVTVYNHSIADATSRIFKHFADEGFVEFRQTFRFWEETGTPYRRVKQHKAPTINDCLYRNMYRFKKIIVLDFDEVITPRLHWNLSQMLSAIDAQYYSDHPHRTYYFRNVFFFFDLPVAEEFSPKHFTLYHRAHLPPSPMGYWTKGIVDPLACTNMHHHYCWRFTKHFDTKGKTIEVNTTIGMNHHYKTCHFGQKCSEKLNTFEYDDTMVKFKDKLIPRVDEQLKKLSLDPL